MIDLSSLSENDRLDYAVDFAIRHALDDLAFAADYMNLEERLKLADALLSILSEFDINSD